MGWMPKLHPERSTGIGVIDAPAVAPPISDAELRAWLAREIEKPCGAFLPLIQQFCGDPANWLVHGRCVGECPRDVIRTRYLCDHHRSTLHQATCVHCDGPVEFTFVERIRGGA